MTQLPPFHTFYQHKLANKLDELEQQRGTLLRKGLIGAGLLILGGVLFVMLPGIGLVFLIPAFIGAIIYFAQFGSGYKKWYKRFKDEIIREIITHVSPQLNYFPTQKMPLAEFRQSKLFLQRPNRYNGDDMIQGKIDNTTFACSELFVQHKQQSGKDTHYVTIFRGLFVKTDFNKHFNGETYVLPDTAEKLLGGFGRWLQELNFTRPDRVQLESPDFERQFAVYSTDQVEARYILTPSLMERIINLRGTVKNQIALSFLHNHLYLAITAHRKLLEPSLFATINNPSRVEKYYEDIRMIVSIVDELNLNLRIWTKE